MLTAESLTWWRLLVPLRGTTLQRIWRRLTLVVLASVVVTFLHERHGLWHGNLTIAPLSLIALALNIFLGFRNNTSYDRFWEGRKLWGTLVNVSRTFGR